jgi:hypothetical protein
LTRLSPYLALEPALVEEPHVADSEELVLLLLLAGGRHLAAGTLILASTERTSPKHYLKAFF